jgi:small-conductance mechanosensitive channel
VSGVVKNRVYTDRTSRVQVAVPLPRDVDPDRIVQVLRDAAEAHADVLEDPPPRVFLKAIGASSLDFELVCFVAEVDVSARVTSDLNFAIWRKIREEGLLPPSSSKPEAETETTKDVEVRVIARNDDEETTR